MATTSGKPPVSVNGVRYRWPKRPVVVVCTDGGDPAYLQAYLADGAIPNIARFIKEGFSTVADGTVPSFTCPNNMSIITGTPAGDVVVISTADVCVGASEADHDLSGLEGHRLRTHGGVSEAKVRFLLNVPLNDEYKLKAGVTTLKSYQVFDFALNGTMQ